VTIRAAVPGLRRGVFVLLAFLTAATAAVAGPACTSIDAVPYEVTAPGLYCLTHDLTYDGVEGAAILVLSDDVTIDLGPFTLTGTGGPGTFSTGIFASDRRGITVRNGTISGFLYGLLILDEEATHWSLGGGHLVRNVTFLANYFRGVRTEGRGNVIEGCHVSGTGATTIFGAGNFAFGIEVFGPGTQVTRNLVEDTVAGAGGESVGISLSDSCYGSVVEGNMIQNPALSATFRSFGVWIGGGSSVLLIDNRFSRVNLGGAYEVQAFGLYRDNLSAGCDEVVRECINSDCSANADNPNVIDGGGNN